MSQFQLHWVCVCWQLEIWDFKISIFSEKNLEISLQPRASLQIPRFGACSAEFLAKAWEEKGGQTNDQSYSLNLKGNENIYQYRTKFQE